MEKKNRAFHIVISILLIITILWTAYLSFSHFTTKMLDEIGKTNEHFGLYICDVPVKFNNAADVFGDGTVVYNKAANTLILNNADLECEGAVLFSRIDLNVELIGENKLTCTGGNPAAAVYISDSMLRKDLFIGGEGSLDIAVTGEDSTYTVGIVAENLVLSSDVAVTLSDSSEVSTGLECGFLLLSNASNASIAAGASNESTAVYVRGDLLLEGNSSLHAIGAASAERSFGIECTGTLTAQEGSAITAASGGDNAGIVCYGAVVDFGADIQSEIDAIGGVQKR